MELVRHTMQRPRIFYKWSCPCGWMSKLFTDAFEAAQFFNRRGGLLPDELGEKPKVRVTRDEEEQEPEDEFGEADEDLAPGVDFDALANFKDQVENRRAAYTGEIQGEEF